MSLMIDVTVDQPPLPGQLAVQKACLFFPSESILRAGVFFYACAENLLFFYAYVEKFHAFYRAKRVISAHSTSTHTLKLTRFD
jgi:hypothetical protein